MKVRDVSAAIETLAPPTLAADWDNVGLLVGDADAEVRKLLLCIDLTADVLAEAAQVWADMVLAYHPVIFKPVSRVTADDSPVLYRAIRKGIAVYCCHTALDAAPGGTNDVLADTLGLDQTRPLEPTARDGECKIVVFVPQGDLQRVAEAAFSAGAGRIGNYFDCSFFTHGIGTFCGRAGSRPTIGSPGEHEAAEELRLEVVAPRSRVAEVTRDIRAAHSYETPAFDVYPLVDYPEGAGMGRYGRLARPVKAGTLIRRVKKATGLAKVLVAGPGAEADSPTVEIAAACAGSCGSLWRRAADAGAQFYLTGEMRHHDALAAAGRGMTVCCLGHSNSERITLVGVAEQLASLPGKLNVAVSRRDRDPLQVV